MKAKKLTKETVLDLGVQDKKFPEFVVGDSIEVALLIKEGSKERIQLFAGDVISFKNNGISTTFKVRKIGANNIGVEKTFPIHSPIIDKIKIIKRGEVKRAKLYYLRDRVGKAARIKEKVRKKIKKTKIEVKEQIKK